MFEEKRKEMVESLKRRGYLKKKEVIEAFSKVPREKFVSQNTVDDAYADHPLPIGRGQTISAPSMIVIMLEALEVRRGDKILEIGTGSGYNSALLSELVGPEGRVYTIERLEKLANKGRENLEKSGYEEVEVVVRDGTKGYPEEAPWDRILITACSPKVPEPLVEQLKVGGKMAAPVGDYYMSQTLLVIKKKESGETEIERHGGCAFVPLVGEYGWDEEEAK